MQIRTAFANPRINKAFALRLLRPARERGVLRMIERLERTGMFNGVCKPSTLLGRQFPVFFVSAAEMKAIVELVPPELKRAVIEKAKEFLSGRFKFRAAPPVEWSRGVDWRFRAENDADWNADLNRLEWVTVLLRAWHYSEDDSFVERADEVVRDWRDKNRVGTEAWHDPFEVAQRINTMFWILFLGMPSANFSEEAFYALTEALIKSGYWTEARLEYHIPNNHLLIEAIRLMELGLLFPEWERAKRWTTQGLLLVEQEVIRQVLPDGVHAERSVFYQRLVVEALLELIILSNLNNIRLSPVLMERVTEMTLFLYEVQRHDGEYPLLGDGFCKDSLLRYDLGCVGREVLGVSSEESPCRDWTYWVLANVKGLSAGIDPGRRKLRKSRLWLDGGYGILRDDRNNSLLMDFGDFGMSAAPGHGHADCLNVEICADGFPIIVDSGTYSWQRGELWRHAFRSTRAHNTIVIDGQDQTALHGMFGTGRLARGFLETAFFGEKMKVLVASHDGYRRVPGNVIHKRCALHIAREGWLIVDLLKGEGTHEVELLWHFHPDVKAFLMNPGGAMAAHDSGLSLDACWSAGGMIDARIAHGQTDPPLGWVSLESGRKIKSDVLTIKGKLALPSWLATFFKPIRTAVDAPILVPLETSDGVALELQLTTGHLIAFFSKGKRGGRFANWTTDAEIAIVCEEPRQRTLLLVNGGLLMCGNCSLVCLPEKSPGIEIQRPVAS